MAQRTKDERVIVCDLAIETALTTMRSGDDALDRVQALDLIVRRAVKRRTVNRQR